jgi:hypothetical protein
MFLVLEELFHLFDITYNKQKESVFQTNFDLFAAGASSIFLLQLFKNTLKN